MSQRYDVIVIGLGAMGTAACHHLSRRGLRVLGLERFDFPHPYGSSHGFSRMIRLAYREHPDYVPLVKSAFSLWQDLEAESGEKLMHVTGGLYMGPLDGVYVGGALASASKHGLPYELLDRGELGRRYPQFQVPDDFVGMLEKNAGFIVPEKAVAVHAGRAMRQGAELHGQEPVLRWSTDKSGVEVVTDRGSYRAEQAIFCGGAWTDQLVRNLGVPLRVSRQVLGWVWPKKPELFEFGRIPSWAIDNRDGSSHYGFPMTAESPGFKIAHNQAGSTTDPDDLSRLPRPGDEQTFRDVLRQRCPDADGPLLSLRICLYTNTPDRNFIIDRHPTEPRIVLACGFSGHGFKFATVVGQILADLVSPGKTEHPIGFLGLSRFQRS